MALESINPATGERLRTYEEFPPAQVASIIEGAHTAHLQWRRESHVDRAAVILRTARALHRERARLAGLITAEMGKPITQALAEVDKCAACCEHFADNAQWYLARENIRTEARDSYVLFQPLGVVLAVMPWNFPFWQVFRAAVPALLAGNGMVLKHASNVCGCALACEELFRAGGLPEGLFRTVLVGSGRVWEMVVHPLVRGVTLTGSTPAGAAVAAQAGAALKKTVLELGGSDPYLVLEDADLEAAAETCAAARLINTGQSCIAAKRFIVVESVKPRFEELLVAAMQRRKMGNPLEPDTDVGPLARADLREELHRQVRQSVDCGARLLCGGEIPPGPGAFYPATVLTGVERGMPVCEEETFGPVAAILGVPNEAEAVRVANDSAFGLGAAVFTRDLERGQRVAAELEAGCVFVNDFVRSDPRLPFGGVKQSGYGRELSAFGIREFVNVKTVYVK